MLRLETELPPSLLDAEQRVIRPFGRGVLHPWEAQWDDFRIGFAHSRVLVEL